MAVLRNLARMTTPTVGQGDLTLGAAVTGFLSLAQAGVVDGDSVSYGIFDYDGSGNHIASEVGRGTYNAGLGTLTRNVLDSTNGGAPIVLSGNAQVLSRFYQRTFQPIHLDYRIVLIKDMSPMRNWLFWQIPVV